MQKRKKGQVEKKGGKAHAAASRSASQRPIRPVSTAHTDASAVPAGQHAGNASRSISSGGTVTVRQGRTKQKRKKAGWSGLKGLFHFGEMDVTFLILILILLTFGLVMLFSASYAVAYYKEGDSFFYVKKQAIFVVMGIIGMLFVSTIDYHVLKRWVYWIFAGATVLMIIVLFMPPIKGARRWIVFPVQFQPSEVMKFAVIVLFSYMISINYNKMKKFSYGMLPFMCILGLVAGLMMLEPHLSGTLLICAIGFTIMFVGGTRLRHIVIVGVIGLLALTAVVIILIKFKGVDYFLARIQSWRDPFSDAQGDTWQTVQSLITIGSGGFWGLGLGNSRQKYMYLPEPQNDFIFSIICEELGFIGGMVVILLFVLFCFRGFYIASKAPDKFGMLMAVGLTVQIGLQALLNIAVVTNTIPNTGISLPFFSYGGTALVMQLLQMGVLLNISRQAAVIKT